MRTSYHPQTAKFLATVAQNMPEISGEMMQGWIENPAGLGKALKEALSSLRFKIWRTIRLGAGPKTADEFRKAIKANGMRISDGASDILGKPAFTVVAEETEVDLVLLTTAELTGKAGGTTAEVFIGAQRLGLEKCPAEVGPQLRLQHRDQALGEWCLVGMGPITDSDGNPRLFNVALDVYGLWLHSDYGNPDYFWDADYLWVFVSPASKVLVS